MIVERKLDGPNAYIASAPNASQSRRYLLALVEARQWLGQTQFDRVRDVLRKVERNLRNWRSMVIEISVFCGMQGFVCEALCYAYLGKGR